MDASMLFNFLLSVGGTLILIANGWVLFAVSNVRSKILKLEEDARSQTAATSAVRELVLGNYITRGEMKDVLQQHTSAILASVKGLADALNRHMDEEDARNRQNSCKGRD